MFSCAVTFVATENDPAQTLIDFVRSIGDGFEHLGWASTANGWALTKVSQRYPRIVAAMLQVASCGLHLNGVVAARVGGKVPALPGLHDFEYYTMRWRIPRRQGNHDAGIEAM